MRPALRALWSADRLACGPLSGMRRSPNRLQQRAFGTSLFGRRPESGGGLERAWSQAPGHRTGRNRCRGRPTAAGKGAYLCTGTARTGALSRLPSGPLAGARAGANLGAAVRSTARAGRLAEAPARPCAKRAQSKCRRGFRASARCQPTYTRLSDRRCLHQRRYLLGLRKCSAPGRLPPGRGSCTCEGCSRTLEGGRVGVRTSDRPD
jgi:hypothetical protein